MHARFILYSGDDAGIVVGLEEGRTYVLGRSRDSDIYLDDVGASRTHAIIRQDAEGEWTIRDTGSSNGTFVNAEPIRTTILRDGDRITVGTCEIICSAVENGDTELPGRAAAAVPPPVGLRRAADNVTAVAVDDEDSDEECPHTSIPPAAAAAPSAVDDEALVQPDAADSSVDSDRSARLLERADVDIAEADDVEAADVPLLHPEPSLAPAERLRLAPRLPPPAPSMPPAVVGAPPPQPEAAPGDGGQPAEEPVPGPQGSAFASVVAPPLVTAKEVNPAVCFFRRNRHRLILGCIVLLLGAAGLAAGRYLLRSIGTRDVAAATDDDVVYATAADLNGFGEEEPDGATDPAATAAAAPSAVASPEPVADGGTVLAAAPVGIDDGRISVIVATGPAGSEVIHLSLDGKQAAYCQIPDPHTMRPTTLVEAKRSGIDLCPRCMWFASNAATASPQWLGPGSGNRLVHVSPLIILDRKTGMLWERGPGATAVGYHEAVERCAKLDLDGIRGWRLPLTRMILDLEDALAESGGAVTVGTHQGGYWMVDTTDRAGTRNARGVRKIDVPPQAWGGFIAATICRVTGADSAADVAIGTLAIGVARRQGTPYAPPPTRTHDGLYPIPIQPVNDELKGYVDKEGTIVIPPRFRTAGPFSEGYAYVELDDPDGGAKQCAYITTQGRVAFRLDHCLSGAAFSSGLAAVEIGGGGVTTRSTIVGGKTVLHGKIGYVDKTGAFIIKPQFDAAGPFAEERARVQMGGKWGYIDSVGAFAVTPRFEDAGDVSEGRAAVRIASQEEGTHWAYIDPAGEIVVAFENPTLFDAGSFHQGLARTSRHGGVAYVDVSGQVVLTDPSGQCGDFSEGLATARADAGWGFIDTSGRFAIQPRFSEVRPCHYGLAAVTRGAGWGYISASGKVVIDYQFREAWDFDGPVARARRLSKMLYINRRGQTVWEDP